MTYVTHSLVNLTLLIPTLVIPSLANRRYAFKFQTAGTKNVNRFVLFFVETVQF